MDEIYVGQDENTHCLLSDSSLEINKVPPITVIDTFSNVEHDSTDNSLNKDSSSLVSEKTQKVNEGNF